MRKRYRIIKTAPERFFVEQEKWFKWVKVTGWFRTLEEAHDKVRELKTESEYPTVVWKEPRGHMR